MPFYDLKCRKCGKEFNVMASISDRENMRIKCENCGSNQLDAVFSNISIIKDRGSHDECPNSHICGGCCHH